MIANMNEKGRQTKLLAAVAVFAMVICALAVVMPSSDVNAVNGDSATNMPEPVNGTVTLTGDLPLDGRYYVPENVTTIDLGGFTLTADTDDNFAIEVPAGVSVAINNGTISSSTGGINVRGTVTLGSDLVVNSGTMRALQIHGGNATINGAELSTTSASDTTIYIANSDNDNTSNSVSGKLTVNSGTITGGGYAIAGNNLRSAGSVIDIGWKRKENYIYISIADNGPGISDEAKPHIFDMFYSASNQIADSRRSMGLGLALCKSIVNAHGGEITVTDHLPHGSIFTFSVPAGEVELHE